MPYPKGLGAELIRGVEWGDDAARFVRGPGGLMALLLVKSYSLISAPCMACTLAYATIITGNQV